MKKWFWASIIAGIVGSIVAYIGLWLTVGIGHGAPLTRTLLGRMFIALAELGHWISNVINGNSDIEVVAYFIISFLLFFGLVWLIYGMVRIFKRKSTV